MNLRYPLAGHAPLALPRPLGAPPEFPLETFTEVLDPERMVDSLESDPRTRRYAKLSRAIATVLEDYSFVQFHVLNIQVRGSRLSPLQLTPPLLAHGGGIPIRTQDKESVLRIAREVDKSNGYSYADADLQKFLTAQVSDHMREPDWYVRYRPRPPPLDRNFAVFSIWPLKQLCAPFARRARTPPTTRPEPRNVTVRERYISDFMDAPGGDTTVPPR